MSELLRDDTPRSHYEALVALVNRLREVHSDDAYKSVWTINQIHAGPYQGPTYTEELEAAMVSIACVPSATATTYDAVADAVNEIADAAAKAFMDFHGLDVGCWDSDNIVQDVKRGIVRAIEDLPRTPKQELDKAHAIGFREGQASVPSHAEVSKEPIDPNGAHARGEMLPRCPKCDSPDPRRHPAVQFEGEVQLCRHPWHSPTADEIEAKERAEALPPHERENDPVKALAEKLRPSTEGTPRTDAFLKAGDAARVVRCSYADLERLVLQIADFARQLERELAGLAAMHRAAVSVAEAAIPAPVSSTRQAINPAMLAALRDYSQQDPEGVFVGVSRQALDEAIAILAAPLSATEVPEGCTPTDARVLREANAVFAEENRNLRRALRFYAHGDHYTGLKHWEGPSGDDNWLCPPGEDYMDGQYHREFIDGLEQAMVEDGSVARATLISGKFEVESPEDEPKLVEGEPEWLVEQQVNDARSDGGVSK